MFRFSTAIKKYGAESIDHFRTVLIGSFTPNPEVHIIWSVLDSKSWLEPLAVHGITVFRNYGFYIREDKVHLHFKDTSLEKEWRNNHPEDLIRSALPTHERPQRCIDHWIDIDAIRMGLLAREVSPEHRASWDELLEKIERRLAQLCPECMRLSKQFKTCVTSQSKTPEENRQATGRKTALKRELAEHLNSGQCPMDRSVEYWTMPAPRAVAERLAAAEAARPSMPVAAVAQVRVEKTIRIGKRPPRRRDPDDESTSLRIGHFAIIKVNEPTEPWALAQIKEIGKNYYKVLWYAPSEGMFKF